MTLCAMLAVLALAAVAAESVTPVEKVITLLEKLQGQIEEEGKTEAAAYDKFACFCKDEADEKEYVIGKSTKNIERLSAEIEKLEADIAELDAAVVELRKDVEALRKESAADGKEQAEEDAKYAEKQKGLKEGIGAITGAIAALKAARKESVGAALLSLKDVVARHPSLEAAGPVLALISESQDPKAYEFHSGDVIETLEGLQATFKKTLAESETESAQDRHDFSMEDGARMNTIRAKEAQADEKTTVSVEKPDVKAEKEGLRDQETAAKEADEAFLKDLTETCEAKADAWNQRSETRAAELKAIGEALPLLREGVASNYDANTKLADLQMPKRANGTSAGRWVLVSKAVWVRAGESAPKGAQEMLEDEGDSKGEVFLQLSRHRHQQHRHHRVIRRIVSFLNHKARVLRSTVLGEFMERLWLSDEPAPKDHFVKVRGLIKDLITRLKDQATAEADSKSVCDKDMKSAVESRDAKQFDIEKYTAECDSLSSLIAKLGDEIQALSEEIASLYKAKKEMEDLRAEEKAHNEEVIRRAGEGAVAVNNAIEILKNFYESDGSLLETGYVPPKSDREGKTVGDKAPELGWEDSYKGKVDASKGIIGILEVIASDFDRTSQSVSDAEKAAEEQYDKDQTALKKEIKAKEDEEKAKKSEKKEKEADLVTAQDNLKDTQELHEEALTLLEKLKTACVDATESYAERVAKRKQEIEALKEALEILENWKS